MRIMGMFDSETGKTVQVEHEAEITEACANRDPNEHVWLLYARVNRGALVQIRTETVPDSATSSIHFFLSGLDQRERVLAGQERILGVEGLVKLIRDNAPEGWV